MSPMRRILRRLEPHLLQVYRRLLQSPPPNLEGDRYIEYSWIAANIPNGPGQALDFGCGFSWMGLLAARRGFQVRAVDLREIKWSYLYPGLKFKKGNLFDVIGELPMMDLIICCSTIEHIGLSKRYGGEESQNCTDLEAMELLYKLLKSGSTMLLTLPIGRDSIFYPLHRVYGEERLPKLLAGWEVIKKEYWIKDKFNRWIISEERVTLNIEPSQYYYGLGLFVLQNSR